MTEKLVYYTGTQRALYDAERRAFTTDLRDSKEGYELWRSARYEWGRAYRESNHGLAARGEPTREPLHVRDRRNAAIVGALLGWTKSEA